MNKDKVLELALEADLYITIDEQIAAVERFAELLIKDCAQLVSDWDSPHYVGTAGELIKSHFGIEQ